MIPTPTSPNRAWPPRSADTLTAALDIAAGMDTGINIYGLRGELVEVVPYSQLRVEAMKLAGRLRAVGLERGDRVGLVAETSAQFIHSFFACQYAGLTPAPLPLPTPLGGQDAYVDQLARLLTQAQAAAAFGPAALQPLLAAAGLQADVRVVTPVEDLPPGQGNFAPIGADDACYIQFSSGSTRAPAGVLVTHRALMANLHTINRYGLQTVASDRATSWLPLYHDMGLVGFLLSPLAVGASVDLIPTEAFVRRPLLWLKLMSENASTVSYSPTFGYELCARRAATADVSGMDLSRWRVAGVGGDMVRPRPLELFAERFMPSGFSSNAFMASYGMAEATLALTMAPLGRGLRQETLSIDLLERDSIAAAGANGSRTRTFARCGPVLPGHELEVRDDHGFRLSEGSVGRIFVRGPSLMKGYFGEAEASAAVLGQDGWLDTGDLGFLLGGELVPTGRSKDLILSNGRNIWPQDLEWTVEAEIAGLRGGDVAAFSAGDDTDAVVVVVQTRTRDADVRHRLALEVAGLLRARHSVEADVRLVNAGALPQTSSGKLRRSKVRESYLTGAFEPA